MYGTSTCDGVKDSWNWMLTDDDMRQEEMVSKSESTVGVKLSEED